MNASREVMLERGLAEFDRAARRRRMRRRTGALMLMALALGGASWIGSIAGGPNRPAHLPSYVQIITDLELVALELDLAGACERVAEREGHLYVVECSHD